jgi:PHP family Zn ribbon phosphoesterase
MDRPLAHCTRCDREWRSEAMLEGLRLLGQCPRCGGEIQTVRFEASSPSEAPALDPDRPPHLVLGIPRPDRRS